MPSLFPMLAAAQNAQNEPHWYRILILVLLVAYAGVMFAIAFGIKPPGMK